MTGQRSAAGVSRRHFHAGGAAVGALAMAAPAVHAQARSVKVGAFGGFFEETFKAAIWPEFTAATGIGVESVSQPSSDAWLPTLQRRLGVTTILVTHDQREAMTTADRTVVFSQGRVPQQGAPMEVYRNPVSSFVATFLGTSNLLEATVRGGMAIVDGVAFLGLAMAAGLGQAGPATLSFRPEDLVAGPGPADDCAATVDGRLVFRRDLGATSELHVAWGGRTLVALAPAAAAFAPGGELRLGFRHAAGRLLAR